ncbi:hypothetical protein C8R43DRAFT_1022260 [Mycena crocata]|nr:hypothetical protein C8R43DRAFT_1022260 [Mycena crocata]
MTRTDIFITGATGFVGGTVLSLLLAHENTANFNITALVRSSEKAEKLLDGSDHKINVVVGSHSDPELVERLASEAGVIFSMADCDDIALAKAQLRGAKKRYNATGTQTEFIHVSGGGTLADDSFGMYGPQEILDDTDSVKIAALPSSQLHRSVDIELVEGDKEGYVKTYIVVPGIIYGLATGKIAGAAAHNTRNQHLINLCNIGVGRKEAFFVGEGKNELTHVEINELADLIMLVYDSIMSKTETPTHGMDGYYFAENGAYKFLYFAEILQKVLAESGRTKADSKGPTKLLAEEETQIGMAYIRMIGGNIRCKSSRSRSLGWSPVKSDFLDDLCDELTVTL